jgi:hypothetical protein
MVVLMLFNYVESTTNVVERQMSCRCTGNNWGGGACDTSRHPHERSDEKYENPQPEQ